MFLQLELLHMHIKPKAFLVVPSVIGMLCVLFGVLGYLICWAVGIPDCLGLPLWARVVGGVLLLVGGGFLGWVFKYRSPVDIVVSTYFTMRALVRWKPAATGAARAEPLVALGPQRFVRNPMYFAVVVMVFGWWLLLDRTLVLFMAFFFLLWFNLVVIRFEERELRALFGDQYDAYVKAVPRLLPSLRRRWK